MMSAVMSLLSVLIVAFFSLVTGAQFSTEPESIIQVEGLKAIFQCLYQGASSQYGWVLNGTLPSTLPSNIVTTLPTEDFPTATLTIPAIPQYNNTVVQCEAVIRERENPFVQSESVTLQVQGPLQHVTDLHFCSENQTPTTITISWIPPFSLNLTTTEPDIQYCVDVYSVTGGGADLLESVCDITDTSYTFSASDPDQLFNFTVTPRSNVEGSLNGTTSEPVQGHVCRDHAVINSKLIQFHGTANLSRLEVTFKFEEEHPIQQLCPITKSYVELISTSNETVHCTTTRNVIDARTVSLVFDNSTCDIQRHMLYEMRVHEEYSGGKVMSDGFVNISTHDVQNPVANNCSSPGRINITCEYLGDTVDLGVFVILHSMSDSLSSFYADDLKLLTRISLSGFHVGDYMAVLYDLESRSKPRGTPAAIPLSVTVTNDTEPAVLRPTANTLLRKSEVTVTQPSNGEVCLNCSFSSAALTGCVGVTHSAELDNLTLTVLTVDSSGGRDCTVLTEGDYHVAVFGRLENGLESYPALTTRIHPAFDNTWIVLLILILLIVLIAMMLIVTFAICKLRKKHSFTLSLPVSSNEQLSMESIKGHDQQEPVAVKKGAHGESFTSNWQSSEGKTASDKNPNQAGLTVEGSKSATKGEKSHGASGRHHSGGYGI